MERLSGGTRLRPSERVQPVPPYIGQFVVASVVFKGITDQLWFTVAVSEASEVELQLQQMLHLKTSNKDRIF
nr:hypothetical protein [Tanacetum cinerariifolium]